MSEVKCQCSRCRRPKTSHETNAGWWELKPRGTDERTTHWFCPDCAPRLMVAVDTALDGAAPAPAAEAHLVESRAHRVLAVVFLRRLAAFLTRWDRERPPAGMSGMELVFEARRLLSRLEVFLPEPAKSSELAGDGDAGRLRGAPPPEEDGRAPQPGLEGGAEHQRAGDR